MPFFDLVIWWPNSSDSGTSDFLFSGRVLTPSKEHGNERNGARLLVFICSMPVLKNLFGSMQNPGPRQPNQYTRYLLHMPRKIGGVQDAICSRSVGPFGPPKEEKGVQHFFFLLPLPRCTVFLGLHWIYALPATTQHHHAANIIPFGLFQRFLGRVKTRPQIEKNPVGFCIFGLLIKQMLSFLGSKNTNLKRETKLDR